MKTIRRNIYSGVVCLLTGLFVACSNHDGKWETLVEKVETSRATAIELTIDHMAAGGLDAALDAKLGADKYNVTKLKLSGSFNAHDVMTLRKLTQLADLDMADIRMVQNLEDFEDNKYDFDTYFWGGNQHVSSYQYSDWIGNYMFAGFSTLENVVLPNTVVTIGYYAFVGCKNLKTITLPSTLQVIKYYVFYETALETLVVPSSVTEVEPDFLGWNNDKLKSVFWEANIDVPSCENVDNVLLFVENPDVVASYTWKNVIVDGVAETLEIKASRGSDDWYSFVSPRAFTVKKFSYTRHFDNWSGLEHSGGWETIVLPFVPTSIMHETKGVIAPFNSGVEGAKPFWLRSLTADGFVDVTTMEANMPYIISMPNRDEYIEEYKLNGWVTFTGENVEIPDHIIQLPAVDGPDFSLQPTYEPVEQSRTIYSLNVRDGNGDAFVRGGGDVRAFEAYAVVEGRSVRRLISVDCSSSSTRSSEQCNQTGIPQIGDM